MANCYLFGEPWMLICIVSLVLNFGVLPVWCYFVCNNLNCLTVCNNLTVLCLAGMLLLSCLLDCFAL